jgi:hypothetical protein
VRELERTDRKRRNGILRREAPGDYVVVKDALPQDDGGFRKGAIFKQVEMEAMLRMKSLTPGTLLNKRGIMYAVAVSKKKYVLRKT